MFGMEKKPNEPFQFDLEGELKKDPVVAKALLKDVEERVGELKNLLREGAETDDFDEYGILLHGYNALHKIMKQVMEQK